MPCGGQPPAAPADRPAGSWPPERRIVLTLDGPLITIHPASAYLQHPHISSTESEQFYLSSGQQNRNTFEWTRACVSVVENEQNTLPLLAGAYVMGCLKG
jgi:hypothetical protein